MPHLIDMSLIVRLGFDYKVTVIKLILEVEYPIPLIEDEFKRMNVGIYF